MAGVFRVSRAKEARVRCANFARFASSPMINAELNFLIDRSVWRNIVLERNCSREMEDIFFFFFLQREYTIASNGLEDWSNCALCTPCKYFLSNGRKCFIFHAEGTCAWHGVQTFQRFRPLMINVELNFAIDLPYSFSIYRVNPIEKYTKFIGFTERVKRMIISPCKTFIQNLPTRIIIFLCTSIPNSNLNNQIHVQKQ